MQDWEKKHSVLKRNSADFTHEDEVSCHGESYSACQNSFKWFTGGFEENFPTSERFILNWVF